MNLCDWINMKSRKSSVFLFGIIIGLGLAGFFVYILSIKPEWNDEIINNWAKWPLRFDESTTGSQSSTGNSQKPGQNAGNDGNSVTT
ncbi:hypothetical protein KQX54_012531 [Cotesia glomerata]|uniref:Uncharacterized protein n=1 Tax=Cotesia glomerata TaxID=32391 RepID=A0AAV7IHT5_COTGL|nr:hypothetical protein KQX54_012531 [Cotesia glomerata]